MKNKLLFFLISALFLRMIYHGIPVILLVLWVILYFSLKSRKAIFDELSEKPETFLYDIIKIKKKASFAEKEEIFEEFFEDYGRKFLRITKITCFFACFMLLVCATSIVAFIWKIIFYIISRYICATLLSALSYPFIFWGFMLACEYLLAFTPIILPFIYLVKDFFKMEYEDTGTPWLTSENAEKLKKIFWDERKSITRAEFWRETKPYFINDDIKRLFRFMLPYWVTVFIIVNIILYFLIGKNLITEAFNMLAITYSVISYLFEKACPYITVSSMLFSLTLGLIIINKYFNLASQIRNILVMLSNLFVVLALLAAYPVLTAEQNTWFLTMVILTIIYWVSKKFLGENTSKRYEVLKYNLLASLQNNIRQYSKIRAFLKQINITAYILNKNYTDNPPFWCKIVLKRFFFLNALGTIVRSIARPISNKTSLAFAFFVILCYGQPFMAIAVLNYLSKHPEFLSFWEPLPKFIIWLSTRMEYIYILVLLNTTLYFMRIENSGRFFAKIMTNPTTHGINPKIQEDYKIYVNNLFAKSLAKWNSYNYTDNDLNRLWGAPGIILILKMHLRNAALDFIPDNATSAYAVYLMATGIFAGFSLHLMYLTGISDATSLNILAYDLGVSKYYRTCGEIMLKHQEDWATNVNKYWEQVAKVVDYNVNKWFFQASLPYPAVPEPLNSTTIFPPFPNLTDLQ